MFKCPKKLELFFVQKCFQSHDIMKFTKSPFIDSKILFSEICPIMLFNFEIGFCEYDHGVEGLTGFQSNFFLF